MKYSNKKHPENWSVELLWSLYYTKQPFDYIFFTVIFNYKNINIKKLIKMERFIEDNDEFTPTIVIDEFEMGDTTMWVILSIFIIIDFQDVFILYLKHTFFVCRVLLNISLTNH